MKKIIIVLLIASSTLKAADVVLGSINNLVWAGTGTNLIGNFSSSPTGWTDPNKDDWLFAMFCHTTNSTEPIAVDSSENNLDIFVNESTVNQPTYVAATEETNAYYTIRVDDYMQSAIPGETMINADYLFIGQTNFSISTWITLEDILRLGMWVTIKDPVTTEQMYLHQHTIYNGSIALNFRTPGERSITITNTLTFLTPDEWYNITFTFDGDGATSEERAKAYIDGIQIVDVAYGEGDFSTVCPTITGTNLVVGALGAQESNRSFMRGDMYRLVMYDKTLTSNEVKEIFINSAPFGTNKLENLP